MFGQLCILLILASKIDAVAEANGCSWFFDSGHCDYPSNINNLPQKRGDAYCRYLCKRTPGCQLEPWYMYSPTEGRGTYCKTWQLPAVCEGLTSNITDRVVISLEACPHCDDPAKFRPVRCQ